MQNIDERLDKLFESIKKTDVNIATITAYLKHITEKIEDIKKNEKDNNQKYEDDIDDIKKSIELLNIEVDRIKTRTETTLKVLKMIGIVGSVLFSTYLSIKFYF